MKTLWTGFAGPPSEAVCALGLNIPVLDRALQEKPWQGSARNGTAYWRHVRSRIREHIPLLRRSSDKQLNLPIILVSGSAKEAHEILSIPDPIVDMDGEEPR